MDRDPLSWDVSGTTDLAPLRGIIDSPSCNFCKLIYQGSALGSSRSRLCVDISINEHWMKRLESKENKLGIIENQDVTKGGVDYCVFIQCSWKMKTAFVTEEVWDRCLKRNSRLQLHISLGLLWASKKRGLFISGGDRCTVFVVADVAAHPGPCTFRFDA